MTFLLPHGGYPLLPATLSSMAWITSLSQDGCDYAKLSGNAAFRLTNTESIPWVAVGFNSYRIPEYYADKWQFQYSDDCISIDNEWNSDSFWQFASVMSTISTIVGGGGCLFLWTVAVGLVVSKRTWRWGGIQFMIATVCNILSFLWFANRRCTEEGSECSLLYGSKANTASLTFYAAASFSILSKYPDPKVLKLVKKNYDHEFQQFKQEPIQQLKREPAVIQSGGDTEIEKVRSTQRSALDKLSAMRRESYR
eukprot:CAMPEP_0198277414 /NCGR_PEP_ID=MMETSP1447-20131203/65836_1 /TAXON_ID=420782 /ORGANISM="Chaetoceros dichaeta, Strain CCMP1751" /LENGTH=252 /DNA_ID=CAMNT_0043972433 /DNA_START=58 /DNA_END=816 /DNA_ORIENTATION=+